MWSILNLITAILGFIVFGMLIFSAKQNRFVNAFLAISFFAIAFRSLSIYALEEGFVDNTFLMGSVSFVYYLIAPGVYLYFRSLIYDEQSLKKSDLIHFLPLALAIILLFYYLVEGYIIYGVFKLPTNNSTFGNTNDFNFYIQPGYHALLIFAICALYIVLSWRMVYLKLRKRQGEHPQLQKVRTWVLTLLITFSILLLIVFYGAILKLIFNIDLTFNINTDIIRSVVLLFIFTRVLFKTDLLYGIPDLKTGLPVIDYLPPSIETEEVISGEDVAVFDEKNENNQGLEGDSNLYFDEFGWIHLHNSEENLKHLENVPTGSIEKDKVIVYINRINQYLTEEPYTNTDFDIKSISKELQAPLYHIEYLFRYYNKYSFSEFRNIMRVNYVLKNLESGISHNLTIEAIGLNAGFSSRSSFFRVFKAITGKTPKQVLETTEA